MSDLAIRVENLGKHYRIGTRRRRADPMLREALAKAAASPFRKLRALASVERGPKSAQTALEKVEPDHIWALRNCSFDVPRGQILGVIGPNGAGKSTLLKILSRITEPTEGRAEIHGRVGSLLEVGTGFHPELTGRENVYLSGALLGMRKTEIDRKLDEIIAFAETEKFADTSVKHYSSGMYVRLAFSVAAHLDPEILIVDEVLSVGDISFQRKCLSKMEDVRQHGRTILFVSHNMEAVTRLCTRTLLISGGRVQEDGPAATVTGKYLLASLRTAAVREWSDPTSAPGDNVVRLRRIRIRDEAGITRASVDIRHPVGIEMVFDVLEDGHILVPAYHVFNESGTCMFVSLDLDPTWRGRARPCGRFTSVAWIPGNVLAEGALPITVAISTNHPGFTIHVHERDVVAFHVNDSCEGDSARGDWDGSFPGLVRPLLKWETAFSPLKEAFGPGQS